MIKNREAIINYLTLFGSMSTLICCALPALLVSLGLGAVLASLGSNLPSLVWISENKGMVFSASGVLLASNGILLWVNRNSSCSIDQNLRDVCIHGRKASRNLYLLSWLIFMLGFSFAYILPAFY